VKPKQVANDRDDMLKFLRYDSATGGLFWTQNSGKARKDGRAGTVQKNGYLQVTFAGYRVGAHRVVWRIHAGAWPTKDIDHLNGDRQDNRIENLREVDRTTNMQNLRGPTRNNSTGFLGVIPKRNRFVAQIRVDGKRKHLGVFDTPEEAHTAYINAKRDLHAGCTL
jgi:hypothetical protein